MGVASRNVFGFIPELNIKLGMKLKNNLAFTTGYTFMYWSNVAMAGSQMDSTIDLSQTLGGPAGNRPAAVFNDSSYWMQGIDLGLTWTF